MELEAVIVLIAPDDPWIRDLCDYLTTRNIEVVWRPEPLAGIEAAQQSPPDAVVVDERSKGLRPSEIGKLLRSKLPYTSLALLGSAVTPLALECLEAAGFDLLVRRDDDLAFVASQLRALCRTHDVIESLVTANRRLVRQSVTDSMTGLYNHRRLLEWLEIEFKRSERNLEPLSCVMVDIDHFKQVNDTYGHKFGDFVLQEFATLLRANIRKTDILGRYGGEEFLAILPNTDAVGAVNLAEKLRRLVEDLRIDQEGHQIRITASFGVASTSEGNVFNHDQLLQMTDKALYVAKQSGRNRVCSLTETAPGAELVVEPLPKAERAERTAPKAAILADAKTPPHESLLSLIEQSGFEPAYVSDIQKLFQPAFHETADVVILDPSVAPADRERVCERFRSRRRGSFPSLLIVVEKEDAEAQALRDAIGAAGEVVALPDLEQVVAPVLRALYRLKILREDVREAHSRIRALQKKLVRSERLKALGEIASGVAHDFNNALGIILGRSQMLRERITDPEEQKSLMAIERAAQEVATSVRRVMDFFRPDAKGRFAAHFLDNLIQESLEVTKVRWKEEAHLQGVRYEITTKVPHGLQIWGNENELCEAFNNLIFNALDAMPSGGKLDIIAEREDDTVAIKFTDTGVGMSPEVMKKLYDPFFTTKTDKGTGLGLSVVRGIVLRHHGEMDVTSEPGVGTTFTIRLPVYEGSEIARIEPLKTVPPVPAEKKTGPGPVLRVLVVDDEPEMLNLFSDILSAHQCEVVTAPSGPDALQHLAGGEFNVVIADLGMPGMSGWDVVAEVRKVLPEARCIITTGWGDSFIDVDLRARGVDYVLPKPVEVQSLLDLMDHIRSSLEKAPANAQSSSPG